MIAIVIILILSSIIGGVINDHITFYGSPWSVKMQKKKADEEYDDSEDADGNTLEDKTVSQKKYILPMSSKRKLKEKDLKKLGAKKLRIARNEIYARHGRMFQDQELQDYFDRKDWYTPSIAPEDFSDAAELSKLERRNIAFIQKHE